MLKKILLASLLALGLNAAPLAVDSVVDNLKIKDLIDKIDLNFYLNECHIRLKQFLSNKNYEILLKGKNDR